MSNSLEKKVTTFNASHCKSIEELGLANKKIEEGVDKWEGEYFNLAVHNHEGYLCQVDLKCWYNMSPDTLWRILTNPDNSTVFRDIHECAYRYVCEME